jgi:hypothetical protein
MPQQANLWSPICLVRLLVFLWLLTNSAVGADDAMTFKAEAPDPTLVPVIGTAWTIYAQGTIDEEAARRLERLLGTKNIPNGSSLFLDSPGGSVAAAMELGRIVRTRGFNTYVGKRSVSTERSSEPGECLSACTLAFLGGRFRYLRDKSNYGVHRFHSTAAMADPLAIGQIGSAVILQYI